ncbi:MAG: hypothetical protein IM477_20895 [Microcystis sp. M090S1]|uniref:hypothetical protein n=1 Tax=Microcystis sp. M090S1 TaxID=2771135 RepID=UPI002588CC5E|nr:hypothetical protein [Microcystis sp. M090S1]MCA2814833.1 hypothetical protein [Microcystis sp. M090S1]
MDQPFESDVMEDLAANSSFGDEGAFDAWDGMEGEGVLCPIVRGKAGKSTEFGAKLSVSCVDNYVFLHRLSFVFCLGASHLCNEHKYLVEK